MKGAQTESHTRSFWLHQSHQMAGLVTTPIGYDDPILVIGGSQVDKVVTEEEYYNTTIQVPKSSTVTFRTSELDTFLAIDFSR